MNFKLSDDLRFVSAQLAKIEFAGTDQNPKGIRDIIEGAVHRAQILERLAAEAAELTLAYPPKESLK